MKRARRLELASGLTLLHEASHSLPIVDVELCLRSGTAWDPPDESGLTRLGWRVWRMGSARLSNREVDRAVAALGARLSVEVSSSLVRIKAIVIRRNLESFFELLGEMLFSPAFRRQDLSQAKREAQAELIALRDSDRALVGRAFRHAVFGDHSYGRSPGGSAATLRRLKRDAIVAHWQRHLVGGNCVLGLSGDVTWSVARALTESTFQPLSRGRAPRLRLPSPTHVKGRRVVLVDRRERPQSHMLIGGLGSRIGDPDHDALSVANVAFGGTMASPLWQEVREKRGWSYGVSSRLGADRQREAWRMHTVPEAKNAINCAELQLDLVERWVAEGTTAEEHRLAKQNLINGHCFDWDTAQKRLEHQIDAEALPFPFEQLSQAKQRIRAIKRADSQVAVRKRIKPDNLAVVMMGDARQLADPLGRLAGVSNVKVVRYNAIP